MHEIQKIELVYTGHLQTVASPAKPRRKTATVTMAEASSEPWRRAEGWADAQQLKERGGGGQEEGEDQEKSKMRDIGR